MKFDRPLPERERDRLRDQFKAKFPSVEEKKNIQVAVAAQEITTITAPGGFKLTASNAVDLVLINEDSFGTVRLAPYDRWEGLMANSKANFEVFTKVVGRKKVTRLGTRFINRIDIPKEQVKVRPLEQFFNIGIKLPNRVAREESEFALVSQFVEASTGAKIILNCGEIVPALLDHVSFNLDIDAFWDSDVSGRIEDMWEQAELLRVAKNACFESCITDDIRALFQ